MTVRFGGWQGWSRPLFSSLSSRLLLQSFLKIRVQGFGLFVMGPHQLIVAPSGQVFGWLDMGRRELKSEANPLGPIENTQSGHKCRTLTEAMFWSLEVRQEARDDWLPEGAKLRVFHRRALERPTAILYIQCSCQGS